MEEAGRSNEKTEAALWSGFTSWLHHLAMCKLVSISLVLI